MKTAFKKNREMIKPSSFDSNKLFRGTILIPDISGFTKFVNTTDFYTGRTIIIKLLETLLNSNILDLQASEIEGDAILFYKKGRISPPLLEKQFNHMFQKFGEQLELLQITTGHHINMSLKLIAHYGELSEFKVGKFEKLYGKAVIEAHRLLKNSVESDSYILLTDALLASKTETPSQKSCSYQGSKLFETYTDLRKINYTYFNYEEPLYRLK